MCIYMELDLTIKVLFSFIGSNMGMGMGIGMGSRLWVSDLNVIITKIRKLIKLKKLKRAIKSDILVIVQYNISMVLLIIKE